MKPYLPIIVLLLLFAPARVHAQRTSNGERQLSLSGSYTFSHWGGELYYGQYLLSGYWLGGIGFHDRIEVDAPSGETVHYPRLQGRGGYMYRLLGNYSRSLNLYVGGDAFIGVEMLDLFGLLSAPTRQSYYKNGFHDYQFIYGCAPRLELEYFPFPTLAAVVGGRAPLCFGSPFPLLGWEVSVGLKINF